MSGLSVLEREKLARAKGLAEALAGDLPSDVDLDGVGAVASEIVELLDQVLEPKGEGNAR